MVAMIKSVVLPDEQVQNYVRQQLSRGDKLARFLTQAVQPGPGGFAFLPANAAALPADLDRGGVANSTYTKLAREKLVEFIADYLATDPGAAAVFEGDVVETEGQPKSAAKFITNVPSDVAVWRAPGFKRPLPAKSVYYVADSLSRSTDEIRAVLHSARGYPRIGALTILSGRNIDQWAEISERGLYELARRSRYLVLGAFDEEVDLIVPMSAVQT